MALGPLVFLMVILCAAAVLVLGVAFVAWDFGVVTAAWHSLSWDFNWTKLRVGYVIGLILTFCFYLLHGMD